MIDLTQRSALGETAAEFIEVLTEDIGTDGEGLWAIVPAGRNFAVEGAELQEFVRQCILRILNVGGVPVRHADRGPSRWVEQAQFGYEKIADCGRDRSRMVSIGRW